MDNNLQLPTAQSAVSEPVPLRSGVMAESGETYLETILILKERSEGRRVRAVDVSNELGLSKPSVSRGLGLLREKGYITIEDSGDIVLTPSGSTLAVSIFKRHQLLTVLLQDVAQVPSNIAERDACRIEHVISPETMAGIRRYLEGRGLIPNE
ncbi:MAG: metal-dependent transcriptional regulator [Succinivibrionaceae bacterium]|nr:metal-dependent transcriptional regulator [Succinivibrionaceae bacterium]